MFMFCLIISVRVNSNCTTKKDLDQPVGCLGICLAGLETTHIIPSILIIHMRQSEINTLNFIVGLKKRFLSMLLYGTLNFVARYVGYRPLRYVNLKKK